mmetsp:Transcript_50937/g.148349  ORF Transcript_50937/g.148349 Transcript_50937/m.148349 type:complete len:226 (+) Transcript_50937:88-765(+)
MACVAPTMAAPAEAPAAPVKALPRSLTAETMTPEEKDSPERAAWASEQGDIPKPGQSAASMVTRCVSDWSVGILAPSEAENTAPSSSGSRSNFDMMTPESADLEDEDEDGDFNDGGDVDGVVIQGPLEQLRFKSIWRPRWCVLDRFELRVYRSQAASRLDPERPSLRISVEALDVEIWRGAPEQLKCFDASRGDRPAATFRTGKGRRWEEGASARLWLAKIASVV